MDIPWQWAYFVETVLFVVGAVILACCAGQYLDFKKFKEKEQGTKSNGSRDTELSERSANVKLLDIGKDVDIDENLESGSKLEFPSSRETAVFWMTNIAFCLNLQFLGVCSMVAKDLMEER